MMDVSFYECRGAKVIAENVFVRACVLYIYIYI